MTKPYKKPIIGRLGPARNLVEGGGVSDPVDSDTVIDGTRTITFSPSPSSS